MVATSGPGWRLAPSLDAMADEADRLAPNRSTASDGSIGDQAHASRSSFHNPSGGYVDALDLTHDPGSGFDAHARAREVAARRDSRLDHVISNREIWSATRPYWRRYSGANPHTQHAHLAVKRNPTGRASTASWWAGQPAPQPEPAPPEEDEDMQHIVKGTEKPEWYITDKIHKRHIVTEAEAKVYAEAGASWKNGQPHVWPQPYVDRIPTV